MVLVPAILVLLAVLSGGIAAVRSEFPHVRPIQKRLALLVDKAAQRSPTFASLLRNLDQSDVVVYVQGTTSLAGRITGRTLFLRATPLVRYVRSEVREDAIDEDLIVSIAHELQHAAEIARSAVHDDDSVAALFQRIGRHHADGYETEAAQEVGLRVRQELQRRPPLLRAAQPVAPPGPFAMARCAVS